MESKAAVEVQYSGGEENSLEEKRRHAQTNQGHEEDRDPATPDRHNHQDFQAGVQKALALKSAWSHTTFAVAFSRYAITHSVAGQYSQLMHGMTLVFSLRP